MLRHLPRKSWFYSAACSSLFGMALIGQTHVGQTLVGQAFVSQAVAQVPRGDLVSPADARRNGLQIMWTAQIDVDRSRGEAEFITQHVSTTRFVKIFDVVYEGGTLPYSERDLDTTGKPVGVKGAEAAANRRVERFKELNIKASVVPRNVPVITLYATTSLGTLQAIDGETGRSLWSVPIGNRDLASMAPAANDSRVIVANGSTLYAFNRQDGAVVWTRKMLGVPIAPPAISENLIFVPTIAKIEVYELDDPNKPPKHFSTVGRVSVAPTVTPTGMSWVTEAGNLYIGLADRAEPTHRFQAQHPIMSGATYRPVKKAALSAASVAKKPLAKGAAQRDTALLYIANTSGYIHCIEEDSGDRMWRYSTGEPIREPAIVVGDSVYVVADRVGMYCLTADSGQEKWFIPNIARFVSASRDRVYGLSYQGRLVIVDAKTGGRVGEVPTEGIDLRILNLQTDRIFLGTKTGTLQCLKEVSTPWPLVHNSPTAKGADPALAGKNGAQPDPAMPADPADPIPADKKGGDDDLFGDPTAPKPADPPAVQPKKDPAPADKDSPF